MSVPEDRLIFAYLAGIFDGEGTVGIYKQTRGNVDVKSPKLIAAVSMKDRSVPSLIHSLYPTSSYYCEKRDRNQWVVGFTNVRGKQFFHDIFEFLIIKKPQVEIALEFISHVEPFYRKRNGRDNVYLHELGEAMKKAKEEAKNVRSPIYQ